MKREEFELLAAFRARLRQFSAFSERESAALDLTAQQYQALLAIKGRSSAKVVTITALAQAMMIKHNSAVGMVDRLEREGFVTRQPSQQDRRQVGVKLTPQGTKVFRRLAVAHRMELHRISADFMRDFEFFSMPVQRM